MVRITVKFLSILHQRAGTGRVEFIASVPKLRAILNEVVEMYSIRDVIFMDTGEIKPWVRVLVNGRSHELVGGLDRTIHDGDTIALVYPYADNF
ncbi:MAG TPA: MoaD/ThiS family protein [Methylomirabilota bacterium]|nr:MoaD/ThiS family protein [Methylomirabilota bacterium]